MPKAQQQQSPPPTCPGVISLIEAYSMDEFRRRTRMTQSAMKAARRKGLPVRRLGKTHFVLGSDFIEFLQTRKPEVLGRIV